MMPKDSVAVCTGLPASLTWSVTVLVPAMVGTPEITPVVEFRVRPVGKDPVAIDHVYGDIPPLAVSVAE